MPSLFNHENACWGVKRSSNLGLGLNLLQNDFDNTLDREGIQMKKLHAVSTPNSCSSTFENSMQFSVSSNCYYGYQPHNFLQNSTGDNAMDVEEVGFTSCNTIEASETTFQCLDAYLPETNITHDKPSRKRQTTMPEENINGLKKMRQEEGAEVQPEQFSRIQATHQVGEGVSRLEAPSSQVYFQETAVELLKHIHGCDIYLYERDCGY